jgi:hypothetical protein
MERNDNSSRLNDVGAVMPATPVGQENEPTPKFTSKKRKLLCVGVLFLLVASVPIYCFLGSFEDEALPRTPYFYISRDGVLFDLSTFDPVIVRMAVTNSADARQGGFSSFNMPVLKNAVTASGVFVTMLEKRERQAVGEAQREKLSDEALSDDMLRGDSSPPMTTYTTFSIETRDGASEEVVSSEKLFECETVSAQGSKSFVETLCILSEDKLLFRKGSFEGNCGERKEDYFWYVKSNEQWTEIPLDFGFQGNVRVEGFEILREKQSILFLLISEIERKAYVSSYNYQSFSIEKTIELPSDHWPMDAEIRVLSGARHFSVSHTVREEKTESRTLYSTVFSTQDLTKVKEITVPDFKKHICGDRVVISPDLRYVAYGMRDLYLYDVELQQEFRLRSYLSTFFQRLFSDAYRKISNPDHERRSPAFAMQFSVMYSAGFSKDSRFLFASDLLGNVYQWDVQNKKRARKITNSKY